MGEQSNTKQAFWIGLGSLMSFLVGIISSMILSRVLSKSDYGTYRQVIFVYNTLLAVFSLGLPKAYSYFLPKYEKIYARDIIKKITSLFFFLGAVFSLVLLCGASVIASILGNPELSLAIKVFSPTPFFLLPTLGIEGIFATYRKSHYVTLYIALTRTITVLATVLPVLLFNGTYIHALIGFDIASLFAFFIALFLKEFPVRGYKHVRSTLSYRSIISFSLPLMYASIWGLVLGSAAQFFISRYYGNDIFAEFSNGFIELPITAMVVASIATVLLPRFSEKDTGDGMNDDVLALWRNSLIKSSKIIFPVLVFSSFFSFLIMECLYGRIYRSSGAYFLIKNISGLCYIVPFAPILLSIGKSKQYANVHMFMAVLCVMLEFACVKLFDSPIIVAVVAEVCQVFKVSIMISMIKTYSRRRLEELIPHDIFSVLIVSIMASSVPFMLTFICKFNPFAMLFVVLALFVVIYLAFCWLLKISYKGIIYGVFPGLKHTLFDKVIP